MKYKCGDILLLNNGKTVSVIAVDIQNREYSVVNTDDNNEIFQIKRARCFSISNLIESLSPVARVLP